MINDTLKEEFRHFLGSLLSPVLEQGHVMISLPASFHSATTIWKVCLCTCRTGEINGRLVATYEIEFEKEREFPSQTPQRMQ